jgi:hypothetical protein
MPGTDFAIDGKKTSWEMFIAFWNAFVTTQEIAQEAG